MRRYRERVDQDFEFREAQMEARYQQMVKQNEVDLEREKEVFVEEQKRHFEELLDKEITRLQNEQVKSHASITQQIYEDVSRTLKDE